MKEIIVKCDELGTFQAFKYHPWFVCIYFDSAPLTCLKDMMKIGIFNKGGIGNEDNPKKNVNIYIYVQMRAEKQGTNWC